MFLITAKLGLVLSPVGYYFYPAMFSIRSLFNRSDRYKFFLLH
jgi:hypothetical protein